jgi:hypothetical protein
MAAGLVAGSPLTGLGQLELGPRMAVALASGLIGFGALGVVLWRAIDVIAARTLIPTLLVKGKQVSKKNLTKIEGELAPLFPVGIQTFAALDAKIDELRERSRTSDPAEKQRVLTESRRIGDTLSTLVTATSFEDVRLRFNTLRTSILIASVFIILGFGVFAWAAGPAKDDTTVLQRPLEASVDLDPLNAETARKLWTNEGCAQSRLQVLVLATRPSGIRDAITIPSDKCPSVRVQVMDGKLLFSR